MPRDTAGEARRRTRSRSPARSQTKSKSPPRSRSKSPSRTPAKTSSKAEKSTGKTETHVTPEKKSSSSRKSETSITTKNATPKKSVQEYEYVKKSSKKLESESPSRQSSRIAVKLTQMPKSESVTERKVSVKTKVESEVITGKKKSRLAKEIGKLIFVCFFAVFLVALTVAASMFCSLSSCNLSQLPTIPHTLTAFIDLESVLILAGWFILQALLACVPVGFVTTGPVLADGKRLKYRCNGVFSLVVSAAILATMYYLKLSVFEMLSKHFAQLAVVTMLAAVLFGIIAHVAARRLPPKLVSHRANTGWAIGDAIIGRYLNPRIWNVDIKMMFFFNFGLVAHAMVSTVIFVEAYQRDKMNAAMILVASYTAFISLACILLQSSFVNSMFVMHDGFGILASIGLLSMPLFDTIIQRYLLHNPHDLCYPDMAASLILFTVGLIIYLRSTYVKTKFRQNPHDPCFAAYVTIPTISGKSLLASGMWGWCRHPNHFSWILMMFSLCPACGLTAPLPYFYVTWTLLMFVQRAHDDGQECERKHGSTAWARYCQRVRSRLIPYIY